MSDLTNLKKRLVVFCDGTWNDASTGLDFTNVAILSRAVRATTGTGGVLQVVLYLRGVGTAGLDITQTVDGATGLGIDDNIRSAYSFLAQNYVPGDEIFLFGFSRGAFTARSLVGLINATGLLKRGSLNRLGKAWLYYRDRESLPHTPTKFMGNTPGADVHTDVTINFLGVWDTVGAVGIPSHLFDKVNQKLYGFYDTNLCPIVRRAYHALAIDEHRDTFVPTLWTGIKPTTCEDVQQVWFAGAHSDVGGGYPTRALADIPLLWMAKKAEDAGLVLDWGVLPSPSEIEPLAPSHNSSSGLFSYNRIVPTLRGVCGVDFEVPAFQKLYLPTEDGQRILGINEAVHESVLSRFNQPGKVYQNRDETEYQDQPYIPKNVASLFDETGKLKGNIRVSSFAN
jgi:uncharacterized protein (DUF2235 family)